MWKEQSSRAMWKAQEQCGKLQGNVESSISAMCIQARQQWTTNRYLETLWIRISVFVG
jgi:hypothetical protein